MEVTMSLILSMFLSFRAIVNVAIAWCTNNNKEKVSITEMNKRNDWDNGLQLISASCLPEAVLNNVVSSFQPPPNGGRIVLSSLLSGIATTNDERLKSKKQQVKRSILLFYS